MQCPCNPDKLYSQCCEPIIISFSANTAEELMRSRYSAYAKAEIDYLIETCHPKIRNRQSFHDLETWSKTNDWKGLEILKTEKSASFDTKGIVEFKAFYTDSKGKLCVHHEKSTFLKENDKWYYSEGEIYSNVPSEKISRNDPCSCGSGKKYKKCCG